MKPSNPDPWVQIASDTDDLTPIDVQLKKTPIEGKVFISNFITENTMECNYSCMTQAKKFHIHVLKIRTYNSLNQ